MTHSNNERQQFNAIGVSPGKTSGPVVFLAPRISEPCATDCICLENIPVAQDAIDKSAKRVADDIANKAAKASGMAKEVLEMTAQMATDPILSQNAKTLLESKLISPQRAVWEAAESVMQMLTNLGGYMAQRSADVADVRDRIIADLSGVPVPGLPERNIPYILGASDLAPADTALINPDLVLGLVTENGGPTSHTAILARSLAIPAAVSAKGILNLPDDTPILLDGTTGLVVANPNSDELEEFNNHKTVQLPDFTGKAYTRDGHEVLLYANVGDAQGAQKAATVNAAGIGLFRTEFCFLDATQEPSIEEQYQQYKAVFDLFANKKVVVRTLDAGADKPLPFITNTSEENPALGVRGYRTTRHCKQILRNQMQAIALAAAASQADVWVMAPMIATAQETADFVALAQEYNLPQAGIMVEVPAAALELNKLLEKAQFASIGTNDLTQYTMAADRLIGDLADLSTSWQPSVLKIIEISAQAGKTHNKLVGVCGEAAADPALAVVLVGLGVGYLSMSTPALPQVAAVLAEVDLSTCKQAAKIALSAISASEGQTEVRKILPSLQRYGL